MMQGVPPTTRRKEEEADEGILLGTQKEHGSPSSLVLAFGTLELERINVCPVTHSVYGDFEGSVCKQIVPRLKIL